MYERRSLAGDLIEASLRRQPEMHIPTKTLVTELNA